MKLYDGDEFRNTIYKNAQGKAGWNQTAALLNACDDAFTSLQAQIDGLRRTLHALTTRDDAA